MDVRGTGRHGRRGRPLWWVVAGILAGITAAYDGRPLAAQATPESEILSLQWMRSIQMPDTKAPVVCVSLDAETFSHAAPALRDLRLFQMSPTGQQVVPFVIEESYDENSLTSGRTLDTDRSFYETSIAGSLEPSSGGTGTSLILPRHVPVERITLVPRSEPGKRSPRPGAALSVVIDAQPAGAPAEEHVSLALAPQQLSVPVTLGANLQEPAKVRVTVSPAGPGFSAVRFEMRRRSLCFQKPMSDAVTLYLGNKDLPFTPSWFSMPSLDEDSDARATFGPLLPNPSYQPVAARQPLVRLDTPARWRAYFLVLFLLVAEFLRRLLWPLLRRRRK